jgi:hypothetical protein
MSDTERKLTPTERLHEITMAALVRAPREPEGSVELSVNARGDVQITVGAKGSDVAEVAVAVEAVFDRLRAKYPRATPEPPADPELKQARKVAAIQTAKARKAQGGSSDGK